MTRFAPRGLSFRREADSPIECGSPRDVHHQVAHLRVGLEVYRLRKDVSGHRQVHRDEQLDDRPLDKHCRVE